MRRREWYGNRLPRARNFVTQPMSQNSRKFLGMIALIVVTIGYPLLMMHIWATYFVAPPWWVAIGYAAVAGLFWVVPAGVIIRWMARA